MAWLARIFLLLATISASAFGQPALAQATATKAQSTKAHPSEPAAHDDVTKLVTVVIAGTGSCQAMLRDLAREFNSQQLTCRIQVPHSVGSRGGIRALVSGKADLARVSRPLKKKERALGLSYHQFARSEVVFAANPSLPGSSITLQDLLDIYAGQMKKWPNNPPLASTVANAGNPLDVFPLTRDGGSTLKSVLKFVPGFRRTPAAAKATFSSLETLDLLREHPGSIGFVPAPLIAGTQLKAIDITHGSSAKRKSHRIIIPLDFGLVFKPPLKGCAAHFVDFVRTDDGHELIRAHNASPMASVD